MQEQVYLKNTYKFTQKSTYIKVGCINEANWIALENNIFHPKGGGQPSDTGTVENVEVIEVKKVESGLVCLRLASHCEFPRLVTAELDADKRKNLAALHTAGHILNAVMAAKGFTYHSCNHEPGKSRVVFSLEEKMDSLDLKESIEYEVGNLIRRDINVSESYLCNGLREVRIGNIRDRCAGTHVKSTGMITDFNVRSIKSKKGQLLIGYDCSHI